MTVSWRQFRNELADIILQLEQGDTRVTVVSRGRPVLTLGPENLPAARKIAASRTREHIPAS